MPDTTNRNIALLPIKPQYATAIMQGRKKIEFRKKNFARPVKYIVLYASSPQQEIIGYFEIKRIEENHPRGMWEKYNQLGCISESEYNNYFSGTNKAVGFLIQKPYHFQNPLKLESIKKNMKAPQSYQYLDLKIFESLKKEQR